MSGLLIVLTLCTISAFIGFFLGKTGRKKLRLVALLPFIFVTAINIEVAYFPDFGDGPGGGPPMVPILYVTLAIPLAVCYLAAFKSGFDRAKNKV